MPFEGCFKSNDNCMCLRFIVQNTCKTPSSLKEIIFNVTFCVPCKIVKIFTSTCYMSILFYYMTTGTTSHKFDNLKTILFVWLCYWIVEETTENHSTYLGQKFSLILRYQKFDSNPGIERHYYPYACALDHWDTEASSVLRWFWMILHKAQNKLNCSYIFYTIHLLSILNNTFV